MQAIIFDMDGTMVDNMMVHHRAWQKKLAEYGLHMSLEEVMEKVHGINVQILERLFGDRFTPEERERISQEKEATYREVYLPELQLIPGLQAFLDEASQMGIPMAVATASPPENVHFVLEQLQVQAYFPVVLHAGSVVRGKPDPEIYLKAVARLEADPKKCVVFEDSPVGALAASRAGCPVMVVTTTHRVEEFAHIPGVRDFIPDFTTVSLERVGNIIDGERS